MNTIIKIDDVEAEIYHKRIRNIHLRVLPPDGKVRISAPFKVKNEVIYKFAYSKHKGIKKQRVRISNNKKGSFQYMNQETHYFRGRKYK
jgi:Protein of unknown function DUF45.